MAGNEIVRIHALWVRQHEGLSSQQACKVNAAKILEGSTKRTEGKKLWMDDSLGILSNIYI